MFSIIHSTMSGAPWPSIITACSFWTKAFCATTWMSSSTLNFASTSALRALYSSTLLGAKLHSVTLRRSAAWASPAASTAAASTTTASTFFRMFTPALFPAGAGLAARRRETGKLPLLLPRLAARRPPTLRPTPPCRADSPEPPEPLPAVMLRLKTIS
ncbi:MAG: hypothetical protein QM767_03090 [Anaeromyxobacter sp.]